MVGRRREVAAAFGPQGHDLAGIRAGRERRDRLEPGRAVRARRADALDGDRPSLCPDPRAWNEAVVSFDHVWITLFDERERLAEHVGLVHAGRADQPGPAGRVAQGDQDDPVLGHRRLGEALRAVDLDVELEPLEVLERHALEQRPPGLHQVLLLRPARQVDLVGPLLLRPRGRFDVAQRVEVGSAVGEGDGVLEEPGPRQLARAEPLQREAGPAWGGLGEQVETGQEKERVDADVLGRDGVRRLAPVEPHRRRADGVERDDPLGRVVAVEERVVLGGGGGAVGGGHRGQPSAGR